MKYGEFLECVQECTKEKTGEGGIVKINHVIKNNGYELDGLVIMEKDKHISPTIYLNTYYEQYQSGKAIDDIVCEILDIYTESKDKIQINPDYFNNFYQLKDTIVYKVINYSQNEKMLQNIPHKKILDLAVVYYCLLNSSKEETATALIYNNHLKLWGVTETDIHEAAVINTPTLLQSQIYPMFSLLGNILHDSDIKNTNANDNMYVLTNRTRLNGAACILYENVLKEFAETIGNDLYILPSSVHEVILLPKTAPYNEEELTEMVKEINKTDVLKEEVLSNHVYTYCRKSGLISI